MSQDNRAYKFSKESLTKRPEYPIISSWVIKDSTLVDLGCGDGSLLKLLEEKGCSGAGVELSDSGIIACKQKKIKVYKARIDNKLPFKTQEFDYAICNVTLQMVMYPEKLISEMKRISKYQIISFPNFAFIQNRLELLFLGRMPKSGLFGYEWYSTGHIHQLSVRDFEAFCAIWGLKIKKKFYFTPLKIGKFVPVPNLFAISAIYMTENGD